MNSMSQIEIYLSSKYASYTANSPYNSDLYFYLKKPLIRPKGYDMKLRVVNFTFPLSMYLVDNNSNSLIINGITYIIPSGNYSASSLIQAVLSVIPGTFSISYNSVTNKYTLTNTTADFSISNLSTSLTLLGFSNMNQSSTNKTLTSDAVVNLSGSYNVIYIDIPNIATQNLSSINGRATSIVKSIPCDVSYGGIKYWEDGTALYTLIQEDQISFIHVRILGEDLMSLVNFNNQAWNMTLSFQFMENSSAPSTFKDQLIASSLSA